MKEYLEKIKANARKNLKCIVLPEGEDLRILKAAQIITKEKIADIILVGKKEKILSLAKQNKVDLSNIKIIDIETPEKDYSVRLCEIRKHKNLKLKEAKALLKDSMYYATMMLNENDADGLVSGASHTTADTLRPAMQIIKTRPGTEIASSFMLMVVGDKKYLFADCGFIIQPDAKQLAQIAISTAESATMFDIKPKIAMLSFSTKGSTEHALVDKVKKATAIVKKTKYVVDGELQLDAAIVPEVANMKNPNGTIKGDANILIFPDLNSGNIGYKLVQRFAGARAIGPIVQGLKKPVNDLSRGCSVEDIVDLVAITAVQAQK